MTINEMQNWQDALQPCGLEQVERGGSVVRKRHYGKMVMIPTAAEMEQCILTGSNTRARIEINEVEVKEFEDDAAFPSNGFDVSFSN